MNISLGLYRHASFTQPRSFPGFCCILKPINYWRLEAINYWRLEAINYWRLKRLTTGVVKDW